MDGIKKFKDRLVHCIQYADSIALSHELSCKNTDNRFLGAFAHQTAQLEKQFSLLPSAWIEIVQLYALAQKCIADDDANGLFDVQTKTFSAFLKVLQGGDASLLPLLYTFSDDLWWAATRTSTAKSAENIEEVARLFNKAFTACLTDRQPAETSRKWGTYMTLAKLFRAYFHLSTFKLCKNAIRALQASADVPPIDRVPKSHAVSAAFYVGVYYFVEQEYADALQYFVYAYENCLVKIHAAQRRTIVHYLLPCLLQRGRYASGSFLAKHALEDVYAPIVDALRCGDVWRYTSELQRIRGLLLKAGTYYCFETLFTLLYRNLFRLTFELEERRTKAPLAVYQCALKVAASGKNDDDQQKDASTNPIFPVPSVQCVFAQLIDVGYVKGYVSHEKAFIVLSANEAFPKIQ